MTYFLLGLLLVCCYGISFKPFQPDYLTISKTTSVKGLFTVLIFFSHARSYCVGVVSDDLGSKVLFFLGQMIVVMFFFYSGFGIMKQYEHRGLSYVSSFPKNRILKLLLHFDLAVLLFLIVQSLLGDKYPIFHYVFCWLGWASIGNSNWFIFDMLDLYILSYFAFVIINRFTLSKKHAVVFIAVGTLILWTLLYHLKHGESWWYNTLFAFTAGILYSQVHTVIDDFHKKHPLLFLLLVILISALWIAIHFWIGIDPLGVSAILFSLIIAGGTSVISIDNSFLHILGKNCFQIYILQRIPMILLSYFGINYNFPLFIICASVLTALLVIGFNCLTNKIDACIFP